MTHQADDRHAGPQPNPGSGGERLWSPWRMRYVAGGTREAGCLFCNRLRETDDVAALILHRGEHAFVIMNLYPYNTGHVMIVPNAHVSSPENADDAATVEMAALRAPVLRALRRVLNPDGFNLGLNIGATAGAGVADHLHEHVVPRWMGDANFMPIIAATTVMPELIPVTYAKLRAELQREFNDASRTAVAIVSDDREWVVLTSDGHLPRVAPVAGEPIWRTVLREADRLGVGAPEILGWVEPPRVGLGDGIVVVRGAVSDRSRLPAGFRVEAACRHDDSDLADTVRKALALAQGV